MFNHTKVLTLEAGQVSLCCIKEPFKFYSSFSIAPAFNTGLAPKQLTTKTLEKCSKTGGLWSDHM